MSISYTSSIVSPKQLLIQSVIARHNIQWLCHFTHRQNLESIKQNGLLPRNLLPAEALITDQVRADQSNAICLSISKPNKWMFEMKQKQGADLCLILISPDVLYEKNCLFYPHNTATKSFRNLSISHFQGDNALEALFAPEITYQKAQREPQSIYRNSSLVDCETTSDQAEVQCLDIIEPKYILHIFDGKIPLEYEEIRSLMELKFKIDKLGQLLEVEEKTGKECTLQEILVELDKQKDGVEPIKESNSLNSREIRGIPKQEKAPKKVGRRLSDHIIESITSTDREVNLPKNKEIEKSSNKKRNDKPQSSLKRPNSDDPEDCLCIMWLVFLGVIWLLFF